MPQLLLKAHHNQQLFSDHYLDETLPQRQDWQALTAEAQPVMNDIQVLLAKYKPSEKEAQVEHDFIRLVLKGEYIACLNISGDATPF